MVSISPIRFDTRTEIGSLLGSDILCIRMLGNNIIVTNSFEASVDLLEKRSSIYSDRYVQTSIHPVSKYRYISHTLCRPTAGLTMLKELCASPIWRS